jgi:ribosomal protein S18 acetylase RimI-like enzyme
MENILIRQAKKQDIPIINSLTKEMHKFLGRMVGKEFSDKELKDEEIKVSELKGVLVAEDLTKKKVVGYISFSQKTEENEWYGKHLYLYEFGVTKEYRGKGIGEKLMNKVIQVCKKKNLNIKVDTLIKNKKTIEFYRKIGFKPYMIYFIKEINK